MTRRGRRTLCAKDLSQLFLRKEAFKRNEDNELISCFSNSENVARRTSAQYRRPFVNGVCAEILNMGNAVHCKTNLPAARFNEDGALWLFGEEIHVQLFFQVNDGNHLAPHIHHAQKVFNAVRNPDEILHAHDFENLGDRDAVVLISEAKGDVFLF